MSLYLSSWLEGESLVRSLFRDNWDPNCSILITPGVNGSCSANLICNILKKRQVDTYPLIPSYILSEYQIRLSEALHAYFNLANIDIDILLQKALNDSILNKTLTDTVIKQAEFNLTCIFKSSFVYTCNYLLPSPSEALVNYIFFGQWVRPKTEVFTIKL